MGYMEKGNRLDLFNVFGKLLVLLDIVEEGVTAF